MKSSGQKLGMVLAFGCLLSAFSFAGCSQRTETVQPTQSQQESKSETGQSTETPTQITISVNPTNGDYRPPQATALAAGSENTGGTHGTTSQPAIAYSDETDEDGTQTYDGPPATFVQNVKVWIDTTSSSKSGGTARGTTTGTQNVTPAQSVQAEQKPEASVQASVPINVGPGSRSSTNQTQATRGNATGGATTTDQSGEQKFAWLRANADNPVVKGFMDLVAQMMSGDAPVPTPDTQTAP